MDSESCRNATGEGEASTPRERTIHRQAVAVRHREFGPLAIICGGMHWTSHIPFHERPDSPAGAARNSMAAVLAMLPAVSLHD